MRRTLLVGLLLLIAGMPVAHAGDDKGSIEGLVVDTNGGAPVAGATIILKRDIQHVVVAGQTRADGRFAMSKLPAGDYELIIILGAETDRHAAVRVVAGNVTHVDGQLALSPEVTTIHERLPVTVAEPVRQTVKETLPYSDEAILSDKWAVGWLLLDIDATGGVTSFRFLRRPGMKLDAIAEKEVWKLSFKPARDASGVPVPSQRLWKMEWPSYYYKRIVELDPERWAFVLPLGEGSGPVGRGPVRRYVPPCEGEAPLNFDSVHPVYRDCSVPDFAKVDSEAPIVRPESR